MNIFQNQKQEQEYAVEINNIFEILENMEDEDNSDNNINEKWENIKAIIKETKQQLVEKDESTGTFQNRWFDKECKIAIEEMKKAREKRLQKGREEREEEEYIHKRKEAHNIIRKKKKLYIKSVVESIEEDQKDNTTRKIYQTINKFKKEYQYIFNMIRNKNGQLAMNTKERTEIWEEYFDKLLNDDEPMEFIKIGNRESSAVEIAEPTIENVKKAMRNFKNNKVVGNDGIHL